MRVAVCLALLSACSRQCLALQNSEERHRRQEQLPSVAGRPFEGAEGTRPLDPNRDLRLPGQTAASERPQGASAGPPGTSLRPAVVAKATLPTVLGVPGLRGGQRLDVPTTAAPGADGSEKLLPPSGPSKELDEDAPPTSLLAIAVTAPNLDAQGEGLSGAAGEMAEGGRARPRVGSTAILSGGGFTPSPPGKETRAEPSLAPPPTAGDLPSLLPAAAPQDPPPSPLPPGSRFIGAGQGSDGDGLPTSAGIRTESEPAAFPTDALLRLEVPPRQGQGKATPTSPGAVTPALQSDDWDDTKVETANRASAAQPVPVDREQTATESLLATGGEEEDDVKKALPPRLSATPAKGSPDPPLGSDKAAAQGEESLTVSTSQEPVQATDPSEKAPGQSTAPEAGVIGPSHSGLFPETAVTTDETKSDAFQPPRGNSFLPPERGRAVLAGAGSGQCVCQPGEGGRDRTWWCGAALGPGP